MKTKTLSTLAIASASSGTLLTDFSSFHEAAEWLLGHPIWTHEFADKAVTEALKVEVVRQFPNMPTERPNDWQETARTLVERHGETVEVERGGRFRTATPIDTLVQHMAPTKGAA